MYPRIRYYDREGRPLDMESYALLAGDPEYKRVALTTVGGAEVSTVWLGLDHRIMGNGPPLIFETMVFSEGDHDGYRLRYSTEEEARAGHEETVTLIRATEGVEVD